MNSQPERPDTGTPEPSAADRELLDDVEHYRYRCHALETAVRGARAVLSVADNAGRDPSDFERIDNRNRLAAGRLRSLLATPTGDPSFEHVAMLREDLQHVLNLLTGASGADSLAGDVR